MKPSPKERVQLTSVFRYLYELVQLRTRVVVDVADYEEQIWLADVPDTKWCKVNTSQDEHATHAWLLRIEKPIVPKRPQPIEHIRVWFDADTLDQTEDLPNVFAKLNVDGASDGSDVIKLSDHPDIEQSVNIYLDQWMAWRDAYVPAKRTADLYDLIHSLYLQMKRDGHTFEIIAASALLTLSTPNVIRRHLLTINLAIEFSSERGVLTVAPESDLTQCRLETEMIPVVSKPEREVEAEIQKNASDITTLIWHEPTVREVTANYVNERSDRKFDPALARSRSVTAAPFLTFAPAIILRRRGERDVLRLLAEIGQAIQESDDLPSPLIELVRMGALDQDDEERGTNSPQPVEDPLFPLPANKEQLAILRDLQNHNLVRVQGPPGTGKSHTIANVLCHFLANGSRVLITSQSSSALKVLKGLIPDVIKPLCVNLLGNDQESRQDLERSVAGIDTGTDDDRTAQRRRDLRNATISLGELQYMRGLVQQELYDKLSLEQIGIGPLFSRYTGTPGEIAELLEREHLQLGWMTDEPSLTDEMPLNEQGFARLLELARTNLSTPLSLPERNFARKLVLPTKPILLQWKSCLEEAMNIRDRLDPHDTVLVKSLIALDKECLNEVEEVLGQFVRAVGQFPADVDNWSLQALKALITGTGDIWTHLHTETTAAYNILRGREVHSYSSISLNHSDIRITVNDVRHRLQVLSTAPGWFKRVTSRELRDTGYLGRWTVDGAVCKDISALEKLLSSLEAELTLNNWEQEWSAYLVGPCPTMRQRIVRVGTYRALYEQIIAAANIARQAIDRLESTDSRVIRIASLEEARHLLSLLRIANVLLDEKCIRSDIDALSTLASSLHAQSDEYPLLQEICLSLASADISRLCQTMDVFSKLQAQSCPISHENSSLHRSSINGMSILRFLRVHSNMPRFEANFTDCAVFAVWTCCGQRNGRSEKTYLRQQRSWQRVVLGLH